MSDTFTVFIGKVDHKSFEWEWAVNHHGKGRILGDVTFTRLGAEWAARRAIRRWIRHQPYHFTVRGDDL